MDMPRSEASSDGSVTAGVSVPNAMPAPNTPIQLQVGERCFVTFATTLTEKSTYFRSLFSERWSSIQRDGSYFIDADPSIFEHVLRYLRQRVFPVFYDRAKGHDFPLYTAILAQAKYFGIDPLQNWLEHKAYLDVVKISHSSSRREIVDTINDDYSGELEVEYHPAWVPKRIYVCPRGIPVHRGIPEACGKDCKRVQGDKKDQYDTVMELDVTIIRKETLFHHEICME